MTEMTELHRPPDLKTAEIVPIPTINILGVTVHSLDVATLHNLIRESIQTQRHVIMSNVNAHGLNLTFREPWLREFFNTRSEIVWSDGAGVLLAARLLGSSLQCRITYADWIWQFATYAEAHDMTLFFLGSKPGVADRAAAKLKQAHPRLAIAGTHHGYFDKQHDSDASRRVVELINRCRPHVLIVGFGMPLQERWLYENWDQINANVALTGGAVFDYVSGELARAPQWMNHSGLEWLGRLIIEPKRLWRRYLIGNPLFVTRVLGQRLGLIRLGR